MTEFHREGGKALSFLVDLPTANPLTFTLLTVNVAKDRKFASANFLERSHCKISRLRGLCGEDKLY
ncbi:hypothetical protein [Flavilitoribacter nigricans]|uniref:hypothetical protein n=1 Tax=Flavilitoribacter nigricans TaxID=70997 RepID=UPI001179C3CE|nr:hypothetical protein [Flavilitoribacter nigricans]